MPGSPTLQHLRLCLQSQISPGGGISESMGPRTWEGGASGAARRGRAALNPPLPFPLEETLSRKQFMASEIHQKHIAQVPKHEHTEILALPCSHHFTDKISAWQQDSNYGASSLPCPICAPFKSSPP